VWFGVLGPLEVRVEGTTVTVNGVKERRLLALLLSRANRAVPIDSIVEALWETRPPTSATKSVRVYVTRLRNVLEPGRTASDQSMLVRQGAGYVLHADSDRLDALLFEDLVSRAGAAAGSPDVAARWLREGLSLWRGRAYADFLDTSFGSVEAARLEEMRLAARETLLDGDLALGKHAEMIGDLQALVLEYPLRERLWAQLMLALYRSGRQSDALLAFRRARTRLVDEVGVEPGADLRELETAILAQDTALSPQTLVRPGPPALPPELARAGPGFVGRDQMLLALRERWAQAERGHGGLVLVAGPAESGRSRLAAELAHHAHADGAAVHLIRGDTADGGDVELAAMARSAGGRPALLIIDDVGRSDSAIALVEAAAQEAASLALLVVATYDPAHADARVNAVALRVEPRDRHVLAPLEPSDAEIIVRRYLGAAADSDTVRRLVVRGEGLPGRLHTVAAAWAETDAARRVGGAAEQAPIARRALSAVRTSVRDGVLDLQRAWEERAEHARPESVANAVVCPYKGLARFERHDAAIFYGRERQVATLVAHLVDTPLVAVVGPSGTGKSSLVRAGLLPALAAGALPGSDRWRQHVLCPGTAPCRAVAPLLKEAPAEGTVLVVDQFEELFTACDDEAERTGFIESLLRFLDEPSTPVRVVLTIRADYLGRCAIYPTFAERISDGAVLVGPMSEDEVQRAVDGPARYAGLTVEPDLLAAIVTDVRGRPGALPLLSTALLDTWERRRGPALSHAAYLAAGGVSGALARLADAAYARLSPHEQRTARRILIRLADTGEAGMPVRRRVPLEELATSDDAAGRHALEVLVERRLLTVTDATVEVAHEALLSHWPRLVRWLDDDVQGRALRRHLAPAAREWEQAGSPDAELYRGARLAAALEWAAVHGGDLNPIERQFLEAGHAAAEHELRDQRERADREAHARRRLRRLLAGVVALLILATTAGTVAVNQRRHAQDAAHAAEARRLAARALTEPALDRSLLLAATAVRTDASPETTGNLLTALMRSPHALSQVRGTGDRLGDVALSPNGRVLAAGDDGGNLTFWDARTMRRLGAPLRVGDSIGSVAFAPNGRQLAVTAGRSDVGEALEAVVVDLATQQPRRRLPAEEQAGEFPRLAWTPDSRVVAVGSGTGRLVLREAATGRKTADIAIPGAGPRDEVDAFRAGDRMIAITKSGRSAFLIDPQAARITRRIHLPAAASSAAVSADGRMLAIGDTKGAVFIADLTTGKIQRGQAQHKGQIRGLAFSADGRAIASFSDDPNVMLWDATTGRQRLSLPGHNGSVRGGAFAPDGRTLYTGGLDSTVMKWDLSGDRSFGATIPRTTRPPPHLSAPFFVRWSADRRRIVSADATGVVVAIDVGTGHIVTRDRQPLVDLALSPDGRVAYLVQRDQTVRRWNTTTGHADTESSLGTPEWIDTIAASPRNDVLIVGSYDYLYERAAVYLLDAASLRPLRSIDPGYQGHSNGFAFSPDGRLVALGSDSHTGLAVIDVANSRRLWVNHAFGHLSITSFSPNGDRLVAGSRDGTLVVFDAASGRRLVGPNPAHSSLVRSASFSPDGNTILTAADDGTIRLWDAATLRSVGQPLHVLQNTTPFAAYSADGSGILAVNPASLQLMTWDATLTAWLHRACSILQRDFTPNERALYSITPGSPRPCP
jgi:WD40 repeat protein/DNA-binding SARP family transcriptional activator